MIIITIVGSNKVKLYDKSEIHIVQENCNLEGKFLHALDETDFCKRERDNLTFNKYYNNYFDHRQNFSLSRQDDFVILVDNYMLMFAIHLMLSRRNINIHTQDCYAMDLFWKQLETTETTYKEFLRCYFPHGIKQKVKVVEVVKEKIIVQEPIVISKEPFEGEQLSFL